MAERSGEELASMVKRIPDETLGKEFKRWLDKPGMAYTARDFLQDFLNHYVKQS